MIGIKGNIGFAKEYDEFIGIENGYLVLDGDKIMGVYDDLPEDFTGEMVDHTGKLIIPGFVDIHLHAPQFNNRGLGMDRELLDWLNTYTFPEESKFSSMDYATKTYKNFVNKLWENGTTSSIIFGTIYKESSLELMKLLDDAGLKAYVGKVNMDRNSPDFYIEKTEESLESTREFIERSRGFDNVKPIITPRFVPSCTSELMTGLGKLAEEYDLLIQSHLSENRGEIEFVKQLHPECENYLDVYKKYGLVRDGKTIMAHCVWPTEKEMKDILSHGITVAHSPFSNGNIASGIAPINKMKEMGISIGIGSDISGGHEMFLGRNIMMAESMSKMRWVHVNQQERYLDTINLFYMATKGGGRLFGKTGSFEKDYDADLLVIDDTSLQDQNPRTIQERLQRFLYLGDGRNILQRYVKGKLIEQPF